MSSSGATFEHTIYSAYFSQVYTRLRSLGVCVSHRSTLNALDQLGANHDQLVKNWQSTLLHGMSSEVSIIRSTDKFVLWYCLHIHFSDRMVI